MGWACPQPPQAHGELSYGQGSGFPGSDRRVPCVDRRITAAVPGKVEGQGQEPTNPVPLPVLPGPAGAYADIGS
jgi:hypothetical protein